MRIGKALVKKLHEVAGGKDNIVIYTFANENVFPFYDN